ncbi:MAG: TrkA family potassium uptake protein [Synergistaceae bacterium]|nr:TrkA family potassium uptake protein [Synergistaceae bacterium]
MEEKQTILVVGLGRFGFSLCEKLSELGQYVMAVDSRKDRVETVASLVDFSAQLNATEEELLNRIGAKEADVAVVAIGEDIESSILSAAILRGMGIKTVIARAQTNLHARVLARVGVDKVIFPERDMGRRLAESIVNPWTADFTSMSGRDFLVGEVAVLPSMVGKTLMEADFQKTYNGVVLLFDRKGKRFLPRYDTVMEEGDKILLAGSEENIKKLMEKKDEEENGK